MSFNSLALASTSGFGATLVPMLNEKVMCGLGRGIGGSGRLNPVGIELAHDKLQRFVALARAWAVDHLAINRHRGVRERSMAAPSPPRSSNGAACRQDRRWRRGGSAVGRGGPRRNNPMPTVSSPISAAAASSDPGTAPAISGYRPRHSLPLWRSARRCRRRIGDDTEASGIPARTPAADS